MMGFGAKTSRAGALSLPQNSKHISVNLNLFLMEAKPSALTNPHDKTRVASVVSD
jgi:hypothetical protein